MYQKKSLPEQTWNKKKWITFTYFGPETRAITKLFGNKNIGIAYRPRINTKHHL
jgi:hypothetical protein